MIVIDTNLVAYLLLPGERTAEAEAVFERDPEWAAPLLWRSELRNVLATYERKGALELDPALEVMTDAERLFSGNEYAVPSEPVLRAAADSGCSACDCEFVVLARDLDAPLVTADERVRTAFPETTTSPEEFASNG